MKKLTPFLIIFAAFVGCEDEAPATKDQLILNSVELTQNSSTIVPPNPPAGYTNKTYWASLPVGVSQKKVFKATVNSLRINVVRYDCDLNELSATLTSVGSSGGSINIFSLSDGSQLEILRTKNFTSQTFEHIEEAIKAGNFVDLRFSISTPANTEFDVKVSILIDVTLEYFPN